MSRILGFLVGIIWVGFAFYAYSHSAQGWSDGNADLGFWWGVIGTFLALAAGSAMVGTWMHTRR